MLFRSAYSHHNAQASPSRDEWRHVHYGHTFFPGWWYAHGGYHGPHAALAKHRVSSAMDERPLPARSLGNSRGWIGFAGESIVYLTMLVREANRPIAARFILGRDRAVHALPQHYEPHHHRRVGRPCPGRGCESHQRGGPPHQQPGLCSNNRSPISKLMRIPTRSICCRR